MLLLMDDEQIPQIRIDALELLLALPKLVEVRLGLGKFSSVDPTELQA